MNGAAVIQPAPIPFYTVLVLYLGIMAFIGWYAGRKTNNIGDFFVLSGKAGVVVSGIVLQILAGLRGNTVLSKNDLGLLGWTRCDASPAACVKIPAPWGLSRCAGVVTPP